MAAEHRAFSPRVMDGGDISIPLRRDLREAGGMFPKQERGGERGRARELRDRVGCGGGGKG